MQHGGVDAPSSKTSAPKPPAPNSTAQKKRARPAREVWDASRTVGSFASLTDKALEVNRRLGEVYGEHSGEPRREPMHELISTILSQRTTWQNEDLAYRRMRERFPTWDAVAEADTHALADAISPSNFAEVKAPNIQRTLKSICEKRGAYDLSFLAEFSPEEGMAWLLDLPGVGLKTASLVLLFCFHKPVLPVDTHVQRVSARVGLIAPGVMHEAAHRLLLEMLPREPTLLYDFHVNLLKHGQKICTFSRPRCSRCVLANICDYFADPDTEKF